MYLNNLEVNYVYKLGVRTVIRVVVPVVRGLHGLRVGERVGAGPGAARAREGLAHAGGRLVPGHLVVIVAADGRRRVVAEPILLNVRRHGRAIAHCTPKMLTKVCQSSKCVPICCEMASLLALSATTGWVFAL